MVHSLYRAIARPAPGSWSAIVGQAGSWICFSSEGVKGFTMVHGSQRWGADGDQARAARFLGLGNGDPFAHALCLAVAVPGPACFPYEAEAHQAIMH